jgi:hypothetical protein
MQFHLEVSKVSEGWRFGHLLDIFGPSSTSQWYSHPHAGYPGTKGRFLGGLNLGPWIVRAHARWRPK